MQGDSGRKVNVLAGDLIDRCEKKFRRDKRLVRKVYGDRELFWSLQTQKHFER